MPTIRRLFGREILDSRGRPTVQAVCELDSGAQAAASVPSGASTGKAEAWELRDGDPHRYRGLGCQQAVEHINETLNNEFASQNLGEQRDLDQAMIDLDGTPNKQRLGANALLAVSLAFARATAVETQTPLYQHFARLVADDNYPPSQLLPQLTINLFSGGKHAGGQVPLQDVLVIPAGAQTVSQGLAMIYDVYQAAVELIYRQYGMRSLTADEGGLAPPFRSAEAMLDDAVNAIRDAGMEPGRDIALAVDVAASHFRTGKFYFLGQAPLDSAAMIERLQGWLDAYPIVSLEDGLAQDDWDNWTALQSIVGGRALVMGDDLLCTNPARIRQAIRQRAADALLLKVNQIGTLTEAAESYKLARGAGWQITVSARSGETEDTWLADLATGWSANQIKVGSITQSERLAKYNRLLEIEGETGWLINDWPIPRPKKPKYEHLV